MSWRRAPWGVGFGGWALAAATVSVWLGAAETPMNARSAEPVTIYVDGTAGQDGAAGDQPHPLKSISAAIALLPDPLRRPVILAWTGGNQETTGGRDMATNCLELMRRMRPGVTVRIIGRPGRSGELPALAWEGAEAMVDVREGDWGLEQVHIGTSSKRQRRGVMVTGPARLTLKNVSFRTCSFSDAGIYAHHGGSVWLRGAIRLNEHLHDRADAETFAGIIATDHGLVCFEEHDEASLEIGNGSLSASYYGVIRLGCRTAWITSWGEQSNCLAVNNSGRIDLHDSTVRLCAKLKQNTPVGLEHDAHVLGEGARLWIESTNNQAIVLQKASTFTCNAIEIRGASLDSLQASSGSMFVGCFLGDIAGVRATTGASINIEEIRGRVAGPVVATRGGTVSLPHRTVFSEP
jgi:hypothetical protein